MVDGRWSLVVRGPPQLASTYRKQHFADAGLPTTNDERPTTGWRL